MRRLDKADALLFAAMAATAPYSQAIADGIDTLLTQLRGADDESMAHLLNPDAQTDWEQLRKTPGYQAQPATQES